LKDGFVDLLGESGEAKSSGFPQAFWAKIAQNAAAAILVK
jgi:hypothetical protein